MDKYEDILSILKTRFEANMNRHAGLIWEDVLKRINMFPDKIESLLRMEKTGGEPDTIGFDGSFSELVFMDFSKETPAARRNVCFDREALNKRKANKPLNTAVDMASEIGIEMLDEKHYRKLQTFGEFDLKTSSWIKTPEKIRGLGGALFCDRRYDTVFVYHNSAESYYSVRGFRGLLRI